MRYRELARKLRRLGCEEIVGRGKGAHRSWYNPAIGKITTVPYHGGKDLKPGLVSAVLKQLGIEKDEFEGA
jgi:mRNA interferase HicA